MKQKDILNFLEKKKIEYELISHKEVFTADKMAKACKVSENSIVKGLVLKASEKKFIMAVLPGAMAAKITRIKKFSGAKTLVLATETELKKVTGFGPGSAPALGKLLKLKVYADELLEKTKNIVFPAGDYKTSIKLNSLDWFKLESPEVLEFSVKPSKKRKKKSKKSVKKTAKNPKVKARKK